MMHITLADCASACIQNAWENMPTRAAAIKALSIGAFTAATTYVVPVSTKLAKLGVAVVTAVGTHAIATRYGQSAKAQLARVTDFCSPYAQRSWEKVPCREKMAKTAVSIYAWARKNSPSREIVMKRLAFVAAATVATYAMPVVLKTKLVVWGVVGAAVAAKAGIKLLADDYGKSQKEVALTALAAIVGIGTLYFLPSTYLASDTKLLIGVLAAVTYVWIKSIERMNEVAEEMETIGEAPKTVEDNSGKAKQAPSEVNLSK